MLLRLIYIYKVEFRFAKEIKRSTPGKSNISEIDHVPKTRLITSIRNQTYAENSATLHFTHKIVTLHMRE